MSDLKHQTVEQLKKSEIECKDYINKLETQVNGQRVRLEWIQKYIFMKTPKEMSIAEIENALGHKIIIKSIRRKTK